ncbi:hypothetical protein HQO90_20085 [Rhodococcus fascians]|nr:hypothetical protein [Rhodococcus fascians]MBY4060460.1 hypothetical protein [Rhodococcus fascians]MBY4069446.1 hypothetical protein [Rhodococcus fascians]MBY4403793.1 hypothetical protein [Rhodococcus fascians]MBY4419100.1 hypothetical protein [Rhodococcus fascians]
MKAIAFKGSKSGFDWVVVEGSDRIAASIRIREKATAPTDVREKELFWISKEVRYLLSTYTPDSAAILEIGGGNLNGSIVARIEVDGVIRSTLGEVAVPTASIKKVSLPKHFGVKSADYQPLLATLGSINSTAQTHKDLVALALSQLPATP